MLGTLAFLITVAAGVGGYLLAQRFVVHRLRFVDAVRSPFAPFIAGAVAYAVAMPVALLPLVTTGTAVVFGIATGFGTASGVKTLRRMDGALVR